MFHQNSCNCFEMVTSLLQSFSEALAGCLPGYIKAFAHHWPPTFEKTLKLCARAWQNQPMLLINLRGLRIGVFSRVSTENKTQEAFVQATFWDPLERSLRPFNRNFVLDFLHQQNFPALKKQYKLLTSPFSKAPKSPHQSSLSRKMQHFALLRRLVCQSLPLF